MDEMMKNAQQILSELGVQPTESIDWAEEIRKRVAFLRDTLVDSGRHSLVLGISGGVDSLVAGRLCSLAIEELKDEGYHFVAVRLPYGTQQDEMEARDAVAFVKSDMLLTVDIRPGVAGLHTTVVEQMPWIDEAQADFERGNLKARLRMAAQYEIAALRNGLVVGTDHNAEAVTGFYTKHGDGACDLMPLRGLNKRQIREIARQLGATPTQADKPATADLEDLRPQRGDEEALGLSYEVIDDFLEGKPVAREDLKRLVAQYERTRHKRDATPAAAGAYPGVQAQLLT